MKVILASGSPRRKELLEKVFQEFETILSGSEEIIKENIPMEEQAMNLSYLKAKSVFDKTKGERIVIGSDTIVVKDEIIYGKPKDKEDAKNMIKQLLEGDKTHYVITGLSILVEKNGKNKEYNTFDKVRVYFKDMTDTEIEKWIKTGKAMDKAGAYAMQEEFGVHIDKIEGNHSTVVGLPIHKVYDILKEYI